MVGKVRSALSISSDSITNFQWASVVQANGFLGPGGFIGVSGVDTGANNGTPMVSGIQTITGVHAEANVGLLASFGIAGDFTDEGFGGSLAIKPGIGLGIIPAFGPSTITTITTPSLGELFGTIPEGFEDLVEIITDC